MIKAVIFDMDGVITKTQAIQSTAESKVFASIGIKISPREIIDKYSGWKDWDMFKDMVNQHKTKKSVEALRQQKWALVYKEISKKPVPVVPGVLSFIEKLQQSGYPLAIASATNRKFITKILTGLHIKEKFKIIVSGDEVKQGKPNPEIFLLAASKLETPPELCLVIEDAQNGVRAAKTARMKCIAITTSFTKDELQEADRVIDSFSGAPLDVIKNL